MTDAAPSFEESLKRLEQITEQIERGEIGLEESITQYEAGMKLVARCREILQRAELRVQQLTVASSAGAAPAETPTKAPEATQ